MKALRIVFLAISFALLARGITCAGSNAGGADHAAVKQTASPAYARERDVVSLLPKKPLGHPVYDKHYGGANRSAANHPKQTDDTHQLHQLFATGNAVDFHDVVSERQARDPKPGPPVRGTTQRAPASAFRRELPSPNDVRHHSPNPAAVSGLAYANTHTATGINGTRVNRKP